MTKQYTERQLLAQKLLKCLHDQPANDIHQLREIEKTAQEKGWEEIADHAREMANLFEEEDVASKKTGLA